MFMYFSQKYHQNAGNTILETQISKELGGACPRNPLEMRTTMCLTKV